MLEYNSLRMGLEVPDRTHVMPMGYEEERLYRVAERLKADFVIIVKHDVENDEERGAYHLEKVKNELAEREIQHTVERCDIFDMYESLGTISELITVNEKDEVYVNVSTGSKVTAIAGMIACMVTEEAKPYYVQADNYPGENQEDEEPYPAPTGIACITELPRYPINPPAAQQVEILNYIHRLNSKGERVTKGNIIHFGEQNQLPFITQSDVQDKGKYRQLDSQIIDPLLESGYIRTEKEGRNKIVSITDRGENAIRAFGWLLEDHQRVLV